MLKTVGAVGGNFKSCCAAWIFSSPAEWERCGAKVGGASTFFPLRFHRRNPKSRWRTSEIRFASTTSTQSQPPPYQEVKTAVAPVCRFLLWGRVSIPPHF